MSPLTVYNPRPRKRWPPVLGVILMLALLGGSGAFLISLRGVDDGLATTDVADRRDAPTTVAPRSTAAPETTTTLHDLEGRSYRRGDCVIWDEDVRQRRDADTSVVNCSVPHFLEMTERVLLPDRFDAPFPTEEQWLAIVEQRCGPVAEKHVGYPLWENGRFRASAIHPVAEGWKTGDRELWCGIAGWPAEGIVPNGESAFVGRVEGQDQSRLNGTGTCLVDAGDTLDPIGCEQPHSFEVSGSIDLAGRPGVARPVDDGDQDHPLRRECRTVAAAYLGRPVARREWPSWLEISEEDWAEGQRRMECLISRWDIGAPEPIVVNDPRLGG